MAKAAIMSLKTSCGTKVRATVEKPRSTGKALGTDHGDFNETSSRSTTSSVLLIDKVPSSNTEQIDEKSSS